MTAATTDKAPRAMIAAEAAAAGYRPLTSAYHLKKEADMLGAVKHDLERGKVEFVLVEESRGHVSVWRANWIELPNPTHTVVRGIRGRRD
jgi:hypothetical protein